MPHEATDEAEARARENAAKKICQTTVQGRVGRSSRRVGRSSRDQAAGSLIEILNPSIHQNASARGQGGHRKIGNIALKYMSTNTEKIVNIVIGEPEAEACFGHD